MAIRVFRTNLVFCIVLCCGQPILAQESGLVGHWDFDEGQGSILHDRSNNENDGRISGAAWVKSGTGHALQFDGLDDFVDCGNGASLDIHGPMTLSAWIWQAAASAREPGVVGKYFDSYALTLYRGGCWWYISSGGNNVKTPLKTGCWQHVTGTYDGHRMRLYVNGSECAVGTSKYDRVAPGKNFLMGRIVRDPLAKDAASQARGHFAGLLDEVQVYRRALSPREVADQYNRHAEEKGLPSFDTSWFGRFRLKHYDYPDKGKLVVDVDYRGLLPIADEAKITVELLRSADGASSQRRELLPDAARPSEEVTFSISDQEERYFIRTTLEGTAEKVMQTDKAIIRAVAPQRLPLPEHEVVSALPAPQGPPRFTFEMRPGGGFVVGVKGREHVVESSYSFPFGGENRFSGGQAADRPGEAQWKPRVNELGGNRYEVHARGKFYAIHRRVSVEPNRISVRDRITNLGQDVLGIVLANHITLGNVPPTSVELPQNFTLFVAGADHGIGVVALDDVYQLQQQTYCRDGVATMVTDKFGLDTEASYEIEWDVYPTATPDYCEFVNRLRRVEQLNRTVEGAFGLIGDGEGLVTAEDRRRVPTPQEVAAKGLKYVSYHYLIAPADDPEMSLEGIEFTEYPQESASLKQTFAEIRRLTPDVKAMFHIAHGLYATNEPENLFPDSRVIDAKGDQIIYGPDSADYYCRYFSRKRFEEGHRWWIFYPTMENSFGRALLQAIDYMLDEIGATAMYADGFVSGYARAGYTYDRWDGHSVQIHPENKTVQRKMANVTLMALPVLKAVARKVALKGGVVITNGQAGPRSLWQENYITTAETSSGDEMPIRRLYAGPAVTAFGDPTRIKNRRDLYQDVLDKMSWGALYFYYGDRNFGVPEKTIVPHMYPFTLEELHAGWMKGAERVITREPGVYGWQDDKHLHRVIRSDSRGGLVTSHDFSTVDADGVRTQLRLGESECAVIEKLPAVLETATPVNVIVRQYDPNGVTLTLAGRGAIRILLGNGTFHVPANSKFIVVTENENTVVSDAKGRITLALELKGHVDLRIIPANE